MLYKLICKIECKIFGSTGAPASKTSHNGKLPGFTGNVDWLKVWKAGAPAPEKITV